MEDKIKQVLEILEHICLDAKENKCNFTAVDLLRRIKIAEKILKNSEE